MVAIDHIQQQTIYFLNFVNKHLFCMWPNTNLNNNRTDLYRWIYSRHERNERKWCNIYILFTRLNVSLSLIISSIVFVKQACSIAWHSGFLPYNFFPFVLETSFVLQQINKLCQYILKEKKKAIQNYMLKALLHLHSMHIRLNTWYRRNEKQSAAKTPFIHHYGDGNFVILPVKWWVLCCDT